MWGGGSQMMKQKNSIFTKKVAIIRLYNGSDKYSDRFRNRNVGTPIMFISRVRSGIKALLLFMVCSTFLVTNIQGAVINNVKLNDTMSSDGGKPTKLNDTLAKNDKGKVIGDVKSFKISPDGSMAVYRANRNAKRVFELFSVPIGGGEPTKLNDTLAKNDEGKVKGNVISFEISLDGSKVVYKADQETDNVFELYSVPIGGGKPIRLKDTIAENDKGDIIGKVLEFKISPDGNKVIYRTDQDIDDVFELYSVPIGGGKPTKLNDTLIKNDKGKVKGDVKSFKISPDGSKVVYRADQEIDNVFELYSVPIDGAKSTRLNDALAKNDKGVITGYVDSFEISLDGSKVVYKADQKTVNVHELYSVPIGGGKPIRLIDALAKNDKGVIIGYVDNFKISLDGSKVVYRTHQGTVGVLELYSVPIGGGKPTKLNDTLVKNDKGKVKGVVKSFKISPDGSKVVYTADQETVNLYSVPIGGGKPIRLNGTLAKNDKNIIGYVDSFKISLDGSKVVYTADQETVNLYSVPIGGGKPTKLNDTLAKNDKGVIVGNVRSFEISPDGSKVVYIADQKTVGVLEFYSVLIGSGKSTLTQSLLKKGFYCIGVFCAILLMH